MNEATYKVVCQGVADGCTPDQVKAGVAALFKKTPDQVAGLLTGKPMVIKKDLSRVDADKYLKAMAKCGARCEIVADGVPKPSLGLSGLQMDSAPEAEIRPQLAANPAMAPVKPKPVAKTGPSEGKPAMAARPEAATPPAKKSPGGTVKSLEGKTPPVRPLAAKAPVGPQMTCPKCGTVQPEKADCTKCGIVVSKFMKQTGQGHGNGGPPPLPGKGAGFQDGPPPLPDEDEPDDAGMGNISRVGIHYDVEVKEPVKFGQVLPTVFSYPFQGNGLFIMIGGVIFFTIAQFLSFIPIGGWMLQIFVSGYIAAYMMKIVNHSAEGELSPPDWPDFSHFGSDIIGPFLRMIFIGVFSFLPAILVGIFGGLIGLGGGAIILLVILFILAGAAYYPMALLAVSMSGRIAGMMPNIVVPAVFKVFGDYVICLGAFLAVIIINYVMNNLLIIPVPFVGNLIANALSIYFFMVQMHILGLLYNANSEKLDWYD